MVRKVKSWLTIVEGALAGHPRVVLALLGVLIGLLLGGADVPALAEVLLRWYGS